MTLESELRATSDSLLRALDQINDLENEKRSIPTGSERFVELAREIEGMAVEILRQTQEQASLAETTQVRAEAGGGTGRSLNAIPPTQREMATILSEWRDSERELAAADPASEQAAVAGANVRRLREEYRHAHEYHLSLREHGRH